MKNHHLVLLCFAIISIFSTRISCEDSKVNIYNKDGVELETIHYTPSKTIELRCNSTESGGTVTWEKNQKNVQEVSNLKNRHTLSSGNFVLTIKDSKESDIGNYSCVVTLDSGARYVDTVALAVEKRSTWGVKVKNTNVVEGEKLSLKCQVKGDLTLDWSYKNYSRGDDNFTELTDGYLDHFKITYYYDEEVKRNISDGLLIIEEANMGDRGEYKCIGKAEDGETFNTTAIVRVKDKYAALWPFLGICAEVFVLCAIIFIYEKKRNKTELEESDTDQSPDQKNTPDHGKESNLRHRQ